MEFLLLLKLNNAQFTIEELRKYIEKTGILKRYNTATQGLGLIPIHYLLEFKIDIFGNDIEKMMDGIDGYVKEGYSGIVLFTYFRHIDPKNGKYNKFPYVTSVKIENENLNYSPKYYCLGEFIPSSSHALGLSTDNLFSVYSNFGLKIDNLDNIITKRLKLATFDLVARDIGLNTKNLFCNGDFSGIIFKTSEYSSVNSYNSLEIEKLYIFSNENLLKTYSENNILLVHRSWGNIANKDSLCGRIINIDIAGLLYADGRENSIELLPFKLNYPVPSLSLTSRKYQLADISDILGDNDEDQPQEKDSQENKSSVWGFTNKEKETQKVETTSYNSLYATPYPHRKNVNNLPKTSKIILKINE